MANPYLPDIAMNPMLTPQLSIMAPLPSVMPYMPTDPSILSIMQMMGNSSFFTPTVPNFGFMDFDKEVERLKSQNGQVNMDNYLPNNDAQVGTNVKPDKNFKNNGKLGKAFLNKVKQVAKNLNCDYRDLLALMNSESGINAQCRGSIAVGLIQFTNPAIKALNQMYGLNLTKDKILSMSAIEQMDLVEKCLMMSKKMKFPSNAKLSTGDLYAITFLPAYAGREVLCTKGDKYYNANSGLDVNKDGKITTSDLAQRLASKRVDESRFEMYA